MRRKDREITDTGTILQIISKAKFLHLGLFDGEYPYVVPLHYGYEFDEKNESLSFYLHCAKEGHKLDLINRNPNVCVELECDTELISGGENPCKYGSAFASVIGRGQVVVLTDPAEKIKGLRLLMLNQTGRDFAIDENMAATVEVLKLCLSDYTAKSRPKMPS